MDCYCFTVTNSNSTDHDIVFNNCCPFTYEETVTVPAGESIMLFGEPDLSSLIPGVTVTENPQWTTCQECYPHNYKLYSCVSNDIKYTNDFECPECQQYIGDTVYTSISPDHCRLIQQISGNIPSVTPATILIELLCPECLLKCYTVTGTGQITYYNAFEDGFNTISAPARICSSIYPNVTGNSFQIFENGECDSITGCNDLCYILTNCDTEESIYSTNQDLAFPYNLGETVKLAEFDGCWTIATSEFCQSPVNTTVIQTFTNCEICSPPVYYKLEACTGSNPLTLFTSQDISAYVGKIVSLDEYPGCFIVTVFETSFPSPVVVTITNSYDTCPECAVQRYKLTDCDGIENPLYTSTDLSAYLGTVIKLKFCPETCWTIEETDINISDDLVLVDNTYTTCEECLTNTVCFCSKLTNNSETTQTFQFKDCDGVIQTLLIKAGETNRKFCVLKWIYPEDWDLPKIFTNDGACVDGKCLPDIPFKSVRPGYASPACSTEYYERIVCEYSEILYKDVIAQRYGIAPCCPEEELYRLDIKYQLLELQAINNPDYICSPYKPCCQENDSCGCGCNS